MKLTAEVKELIAKARIVSFAEWQNTHSSAAIDIFQASDDAGQYLSNEDLLQIEALAPNYSQYFYLVRQLRDRVTEIVDEARTQMLIAYPNILEPGGELYPPERGAACWRDFWNFLRCITYGIAGQHSEYTSSKGLHYMKLLYEELQVPLDAMVVGLEGLKSASLKHCNKSQQSVLAPYFDHLIAKMSTFKS